MFYTLWKKGTNLIRLSSSIKEIDKPLLINKPRIVYSDELNLLGFNKYFKFTKKEHTPICRAVDRKYFYKNNLIAEIKKCDIFTPPEINFYNTKIKTLNEINIEELLALNEEKMYILENESMDYIKSVFDMYNRKFDAFVVSFSGGKDSQAVLDLVSRVLPVKKYFVVYMDTGMELPCTHNIVTKTKTKYKGLYKDFKLYSAASEQSAISQRERFGPPSRFSRWCCSVRKTSVFTIKMKDILNTSNQPKCVVFEGVRSEESARREKYDRTALGVKHINLMNSRPIFNWNDTEIYLYFLQRSIEMNEGYYKGLTRIGCNICPFASSRSESMIAKLYPEFVKPYVDVVKKLALNIGLKNENTIRNYIAEGSWKKNAGGKALNLDNSDFYIISKKPNFKCVIKNGKSDWKFWFQILGNYYFNKLQNGNIEGEINIKNEIIKFTIEYINSTKVFTFFNLNNNLYYISLLNKLMLKICYCERCGVCEAECPTGALQIRTNKINFDKNKCIHCFNCLNVHSVGCIVASRRKISEGGSYMNNTRTSGVDKYSTFGMRETWVKSFFTDFEDYFINYGGCGPKQVMAMNNWLREAELRDTKDKKPTDFASLLRKIFNKNQQLVYEIIWINLCFNSPVVNTYVCKLEPFTKYTREDLVANLQESYPTISTNTLTNPINALINMFENSVYGGNVKELTTNNIKMGVIYKENKNKKIAIIGDADINNFSVLYLIYKIAILNNQFEFIISDFYNKTIFGPNEVFNLSKEKFIKILRTLSELNFLKIEIAAGLENIHLDKHITIENLLKKIIEFYEK